MRHGIGVILVIASILPGCSRAPASQSDREAALGKSVASAEWSRRYARPVPPTAHPAQRRQALEAAYAGTVSDPALAADLDEAARLYRDGRPACYQWIVGLRYQLQRKKIDVPTADLLKAAVTFGRLLEQPWSGIPISLFTLNYRDKRFAGLSHEAAVAWLLEHHAEL